MKPIRRTSRNVLIAALVTLPIAAPFLVLRWIFALLADRCEWVSDALRDGTLRLFETHDARRTRLLRDRVGTWLRYSCWVCACPGTLGRGMDVCPACHTPQPPNEPARAA